MRSTFVRVLCEKARKDDRIFLLTGDLGFGILEPFRDEFPDRFLNVGVSEQNLVSVAAGLSTVGYIPFVYSIAAFMTMRPFECIRSLVDIQKLRVNIIGIGAGVAYGNAGPTHHALEDISLMRSLQNMTIINPCNQGEVSGAVHALIEELIVGPAYIRIGRNPELEFQTKNGVIFSVGKGECIRKGRGMALLVTGTLLSDAIKIAELLCEYGIEISIYSFSSLYPFDNDLLLLISKEYLIIATLEEHMIQGGLGTIVSEFIAHSKKSASMSFISFGFQKVYGALVGDYKNIMKSQGLLPEQIAERLLITIQEKI